MGGGGEESREVGVQWAREVSVWWQQNMMRRVGKETGKLCGTGWHSTVKVARLLGGEP